jgi:endoglucanase
VTVYLPSLGALIPTAKANPQWYSYRAPGRINEGQFLDFVVGCLGYKVGARVQVWFTPEGSGGLPGGGNWLESWENVFKRVCAENGCTYIPNDGAENPVSIRGTFRGSINIGPDYAGQELVFRNTARIDRRTNIANDNFGGPGYREMQMLLSRMYIPAGSTTTPMYPGATEADFGGISGRSPTNPVGAWPVVEADGTRTNVRAGYAQVMDTSKTPTELPNITVRTFSPDGVSPALVNLTEGQSFIVRIFATNIIPGTKIRVYVANEGQQRLDPDFRTVAKDAGLVTPGVSVYRVEYPPKPGESWFRGVFYTYEANYDASNPIEMLLTTRANSTEDGSSQLDFIVTIETEGDGIEFPTVTAKGDWKSNTIYNTGDWVIYTADGGSYIYTATAGSSGAAPTDTSKWRYYRRTTGGGAFSRFVVERPARYWEITSKRVDAGGGMSKLQFVLNSPRTVPGSSVRIVPENVPADFMGAMQAAIAANPLFHYDAQTGRVSSDVASLGDTALVTWECLVPTAAPSKRPSKVIVYLNEPSEFGITTIGCTCVFTGPAILPAMPNNAYGVNLAGGEFSGTGNDQFGTDYRYPENLDLPVGNPERFAEMDYYYRRNVGIWRIPFKWERLQEGGFGPLRGTEWPGVPGIYPRNAPMDTLRIDAMVAHAAELRTIIMLDMHNYLGGPKGSTGNVGFNNPTATGPMVADFWIKMVNRYEGNDFVWIDLMNEPHGNNAGPERLYELWMWVVSLIRAKTNFLGRIVLEGTAYSGCAGWVDNGQGDAFAKFVDAADNVIFSPHCYLDNDASGTKATCVSNAYERLYGACTHARANGYRLLIGEINGTNDVTCPPVVRRALQYIRDNNDAYVGFTLWAGGKRWGGGYSYNLDPSKTTTGTGSNYDDAISIPDFRFTVVAPYLTRE